MNIKIAIYPIVSLCLLFSFFLSSVESKAYNDSLLIEGKVTAKKGNLKDVVVKIYINNSLFKSEKLDRSSKLKLNLPLNEILTVEISAPNYHSKRFMIDSHVPSNADHKFVYLFEMDLFSLEEMKGVNTFLFDFPVGLVKYDKRSGFIHNEKYTKQMKEEYFRLLEEANKSERGGLKSK
ncbi:MAG: hypothetical protein WD530_03510 [Vicingaceae bacterium]